MTRNLINLPYYNYLRYIIAKIIDKLERMIQVDLSTTKLCCENFKETVVSDISGKISCFQRYIYIYNMISVAVTLKQWIEKKLK